MLGSSPRVWGQEMRTRTVPPFYGIIPTRVGTRDYQVHIRVGSPKSSPRVWGQVSERRQGKNSPKIIPTRVGTRGYFRSLEVTRKDHPHACGDKLYHSQDTRCRQGSSPRVWGQDSLAVRYQLFCRIIPTRVGTRSSSGKVRRWS